MNGTIDAGLNYTFSSIFNSTYNKNGTEGAIVETVFNLLKVIFLGTYRGIMLTAYNILNSNLMWLGNPTLHSSDLKQSASKVL